jgi:transposase
MRQVALDVHQGFCEVAIREDGKTRSAGRVATGRDTLGLFAGSLSPTDEVVMEATGPAMEIARIIEPHVARVVVANAQDVRAISHARVKSDRFDARTLAELLAAGMLESVWVPDLETSGLRRRVARRAALVRQRTRAKNEIHATLARCLLGRSPFTDLFGKEGRVWLGEQELGTEEAETVAGCLRQIDFLDAEVAAIDQRLAQWANGSQDVRRLMSIPGVGVGVAVTLMAAIGDISRFSSPRQLVAYLGLDPKVRQSGDEPARHGRISKRGNAQARSVLAEAAWVAVRQPGPLHAFAERIRARKGSQVAAVAVARKLACLAWQLLTTGEDYAFSQPSRVRAKVRRVELDAGAPPLKTRHAGPRVSASPAERNAERELARQAELAYRRLIADWKATAPANKKGAGATHGHASTKPSKRQAARQAQAQTPAL